MPCDQSLFVGNHEDQEEVVTCSTYVNTTSLPNMSLKITPSHDLQDLNIEYDSQVENSVENHIEEFLFIRCHF